MRLIASIAAVLALCGAAQTPPDDSATRTEYAPVDDVEEEVCSSLSGPFCAHTGDMELFAAYMTPISTSSLSADGDSSAATRRSGADAESKKSCFFQHFSSHWMDSGGDAFDVLHQKVATVDACERLCCAHPQCQSFTFWRGHTCFLRSSARTPRANADAFSGVRLL
jgi:hypothetical protein